MKKQKQLMIIKASGDNAYSGYEAQKFYRIA
jgi:hypothetical protein